MRDQLPLARPPSSPDLGEARRDDDQPPDALRPARARHVRDRRGGNGDDRQVHGLGNVLHARVGAHRLHDLGVGVHRVDGPAEARSPTGCGTARRRSSRGGARRRSPRPTAATGTSGARRRRRCPRAPRTARRASGVSEVGNSTSTTPGSLRICDREPRSRGTPRSSGGSRAAPRPRTSRRRCSAAYSARCPTSSVPRPRPASRPRPRSADLGPALRRHAVYMAWPTTRSPRTGSRRSRTGPGSRCPRSDPLRAPGSIGRGEEAQRPRLDGQVLEGTPPTRARSRGHRGRTCTVEPSRKTHVDLRVVRGSGGRRRLGHSEPLMLRGCGACSLAPARPPDRKPPVQPGSPASRARRPRPGQRRIRVPAAPRCPAGPAAPGRRGRRAPAPASRRRPRGRNGFCERPQLRAARPTATPSCRLTIATNTMLCQPFPDVHAPPARRRAPRPRPRGSSRSTRCHSPSPSTLSSGGRGGRRITPASTGSAPIATPVRPWVSRLIHRICAASRGTASPTNGPEQHHEDLRRAAGEAEDEEAPDVAVDAAALLDRRDDRRQLVVGEDEVGRLAGHLGSRGGPWRRRCRSGAARARRSRRRRSSRPRRPGPARPGRCRASARAPSGRTPAAR